MSVVHWELRFVPGTQWGQTDVGQICHMPGAGEVGSAALVVQEDLGKRLWWRGSILAAATVLARWHPGLWQGDRLGHSRGQFWCRGRWELSEGKQQQNLCWQQRGDPLRGNLQREKCLCLGRGCLSPSSSRTWLSAVARCACSSSAPHASSHLGFSLSPASTGGSTPTAAGRGVPVSSEAKSYDFGSFIIFSNPFLRRRNSQEPRCLHADQSVRGNQREIKYLFSIFLSDPVLPLWHGCLGGLRSAEVSLAQTPAQLPYNQTEVQQKCCSTNLQLFGLLGLLGRGAEKSPEQNSLQWHSLCSQERDGTVITHLMAALQDIAGIFCTAMPTAAFIYTILSSFCTSFNVLFHKDT